MGYAIIETGGKQYKVENGTVIEIEKLQGSKNGAVSFDKVLLYVDDSDVKIGKPYLTEYIVRAKFLSDFKGDKIRVARFRAKSRYRRVHGHRQSLSRVQIQDIATISKSK